MDGGARYEGMGLPARSPWDLYYLEQIPVMPTDEIRRRERGKSSTMTADDMVSLMRKTLEPPFGPISTTINFKP